jgi:hypothetical protein
MFVFKIFLYFFSFLKLGGRKRIDSDGKILHAQKEFANASQERIFIKGNVQ